MRDEAEATGDPGVAARWALVTPHREHMLAVARRRCATEEDAEDCVHEAMLRAAQFDRLDPARVEALLTSVVTRIAADMHRARARSQRYQPRLVHVPGQQAPTDERTLDIDEARWLAAQVEHLPERERDVFRQRVAGYSAGEAAARLSLSYKSVESAFTRARGRMRLWAGAGALLIADLLRRLRERPSTVLAASMAMLSAGVLLVTSLPGHPAQAAERPHASSTLTDHVSLHAAPAAAPPQAAPRPAQPLAARAQPAHAPATRAATPAAGVPHKRIANQDVAGTVQQQSFRLEIGLGEVMLPSIPPLP